MTLTYAAPDDDENPIRDRAGNAAVGFSGRDVRNLTPPGPPGAPTNLSAQAGGSMEVVLGWTKPAYDGGSPITGHQARYRTGGNYSEWQDIPDSAEGEDNETGYAVTGLANEVEYTFQVRAFNEVDGGSASEASNEATVTPVAGIAVRFASATGSATEDEETVAVEVRLAIAPAAALTVPLTATRGTGLQADEYTGVPASVTIAANRTSSEFTVSFVADTDDEPDETLTLGFGTLPQGYVPGTPSEMEVTVLDDDYPPVTVSLAAGRTSTPEGSEIAVTVRLSAAPQREVEVPLAVTAGAGLEAGDYTVAPTTVTFGATDTVQSVAVTFADDADVESDETLTLGFGRLPANVTADGTLELTVEDDDGPPGEVRNLAATSGDGFVTLTWNEPPQNDSPLLRYEVSVDGGSWQDVGLATTHVAENLTNGTEYAFRVRAVNQHGEGDAAETRSIPTERITALPEAAQVLSARTNDASRVRLGWVRPSNAADWHPRGRTWTGRLSPRSGATGSRCAPGIATRRRAGRT